ncbi:MAG: hypothetical protein ACI9JL_003190 [Paracoccaceae bacterium]|jgi:hypothetical protein
MPIIRTRVVEATIGVTSHEADDERTGHYIGFELIPDDGFDCLELETGEFFSGAYWQSKKPKISMSMSVMRLSDDFPAERQASTIRYFGPDEDHIDSAGSDACLEVTQYLKPKDYDDLLSNLKNGLIPATISIDNGFHPYEEQGPFSYGDAPDGSESVWKNKDKENQRVKLESIVFGYQLLSPQKNEDGVIDPSISGPEGHLRKLQLSLKTIEDRLDVASKYLRWILYVAIFLAGVGVALVNR